MVTRALRDVNYTNNTDKIQYVINWKGDSIEVAIGQSITYSVLDSPSGIELGAGGKLTLVSPSSAFRRELGIDDQGNSTDDILTGA